MGEITIPPFLLLLLRNRNNLLQSSAYETLCRMAKPVSYLNRDKPPQPCPILRISVIYSHTHIRAVFRLITVILKPYLVIFAKVKTAVACIYR